MRKKDPLERLVRRSEKLVLEFILLVNELKPKIYIMENLHELVEEPLGRVLKDFFKRIGYDTQLDQWAKQFHLLANKIA